MNCTVKKQNISNIAEKNNIKSVIIRNKVSKKHKFSAINEKLKN